MNPSGDTNLHMSLRWRLEKQRPTLTIFGKSIFWGHKFEYLAHVNSWSKCDTFWYIFKGTPAGFWILNAIASNIQLSNFQVTRPLSCFVKPGMMEKTTSALQSTKGDHFQVLKRRVWPYLAMSGHCYTPALWTQVIEVHSPFGWRIVLISLSIEVLPWRCLLNWLCMQDYNMIICKCDWWIKLIFWDQTLVLLTW